VWLSGRQIRRHVRSFDRLTVAVGCSYEAISPPGAASVKRAVLLDVSPP
jgi:hypothetical protein